MLFDYRKAFDFIDHPILIDKLEGLVMPRRVLKWIIDFHSDRYQRIKLAKGYFSEWGHKFSIFMEICGRHHGLRANRKGDF